MKTRKVTIELPVSVMDAISDDVRVAVELQKEVARLKSQNRRLQDKVSKLEYRLEYQADLVGRAHNLVEAVRGAGEFPSEDDLYNERA